MKLLIQWTTLKPTDWEEIDSTEWTSLPKKAVPLGNEVISNEPGYIFQINIQGLMFAGFDHYAVIDLGGFVRVVCWSDDPEDEPVSYRHAREWNIYPLKYDETLKCINTLQEQIVYGATTHNDLDVVYKDWDEFKTPNEIFVRHGIWVNKRLNDKHREVVSKDVTHGWRAWTADVHPDYIRNGLVT